MIDEAVVEELIEVGRSGVPATPDLLASTTAAHRPIMVGHRPWVRLAERLDEERLRQLMRGLILYSQDSGWSGGSVSPVVNLYGVYARRFPEREPELNRWIAANRCNAYEPFGSTLFTDAETLREHEELWREWREQTAVDLAAREEARLRRIADDATAKLPGAARRGDVAALAALVEKGADWRVRDGGMSLLDLAEAQGREEAAEFLRSLENTPGTIP